MPATYREIGGVSGALARRADEIHASLSDGAKEAARQLFLRLVTLGEGVDVVRRRVLRAELISLQADPAEMEAAIEAFGGARLLSFDRDPETRGPTVEVAHEALLREWGRLRGWIEAAREDLRTRRRLASAARDWLDAGREASFLASGSRLHQFETWQQRSGLASTPQERDFLEVSLAERDRVWAEDEARQARERALERRSFRRLRALVAVLAAPTHVPPSAPPPTPTGAKPPSTTGTTTPPSQAGTRPPTPQGLPSPQLHLAAQGPSRGLPDTRREGLASFSGPRNPAHTTTNGATRRPPHPQQHDVRPPLHSQRRCRSTDARGSRLGR